MKVFKPITLLSEEEIVFEGFIETFQERHTTGLFDRTTMPRTKLLASFLEMLIRTAIGLNHKWVSNALSAKDLLCVSEG
jgi:hypothetical protein